MFGFPEEGNYTPRKVPALNPKTGAQIDGQFVVLHPETDQWIANCGADAKPSNFYDAYHALITELANDPLIDLSRATIKNRLYNNNTCFVSQIDIKDFKIAEDISRQVGDPISLSITLRDSHDGSTRRAASVGLKRLACLNGMVTLSGAMHQRRKHTTYDNPEYFGLRLSQHTKNLHNEIHKITALQNSRVEYSQAMDFFKHKLKMIDTDIKKVEKIYNYYRDMGSTGYRVYNTLTHLSSHGLSLNIHNNYIDSREENAKKQKTNNFLASINNEKKIEKIIRSSDFKELCLA